MSKKMKKTIKLAGIASGFILISFVVFLILKYYGLTEVEKLREIVKSTGTFGILVFLLLQISLSIVMSVIPGTSFTFVVLGSLLFGPLNGFIITLIGVYLTSTILFLVGRLFGETAVLKIVGEDELRRAQELIDVKTKIYLPVMFTFPLFPDDALCLVAGMTKMKYTTFLWFVIVFRAIGVFAASYSVTILDLLGYKSWRVIDWVVITNLIIIDIYFLIKFMKWLELKIKRD